VTINHRFLIWILAGIVVIGGTIQAAKVFTVNDGVDTDLVVSGKIDKAIELEGQINTTDEIEVPKGEPNPGNAPTALILPTMRDGLESTDPSSVNLTSGNIQLVELFAFW